MVTDFLIAGGGIAGSALAILLGRRGFFDDWIWEFESSRRALLRAYRRLTSLLLSLAARPTLTRLMQRFLSAHPQFFSYLLGIAGACQPRSRAAFYRELVHTFRSSTPTPPIATITGDLS